MTATGPTDAASLNAGAPAARPAAALGLLLAAGAGRRMGRPKALVTDESGLTWVARAVRALAVGGCSEVVVVIGAAAPLVRAALAGESATIVEAADWRAGMGASLRAGLGAIGDRTETAALIHLVDLPDVGATVIRRVLAAAAPDVLARASYSANTAASANTPAVLPPGHPVLLGREHWAAIAAECDGDTGARAYLARHAVRLIDCSDLANGRDIDTPPVIVPKLGS